MAVLPTTDMRSNVGTWAVPHHALPAVGQGMSAILPRENYDVDFQGQRLETYYFDTRHFDLRKARKKGDKYLTLRLRCYETAKGGETYALSAKTEDQKWRTEIASELADSLLAGTAEILSYLPANLQARLLDLAPDPTGPVVCVKCHRYAVENAADRLTLDCHIHTDTGKVYPTNVLEQKSTDGDSDLLLAIDLRPIKLSKFLWSTHS